MRETSLNLRGVMTQLLDVLTRNESGSRNPRSRRQQAPAGERKESSVENGAGVCLVLFSSPGNDRDLTKRGLCTC